MSQGCRYRHGTLRRINCWVFGKDLSAAQPSTPPSFSIHSPRELLPVLIHCPRGEIRPGNGVSRGRTAPGLRIKLGCGGKGSAGPCHFYRQNGAQGSPSHSGMSSGITISILSSVLQRVALLSALCSGGSSCARKSCPSGHKNICWDPWSYSSSVLYLHGCRYFGSFVGEIKCRVRIFLEPFLDLIHSWCGNGRSQEGCGCSLVVA